ncbi:MAG: hypothetical protein P8M34_03570 [Saprospiraceae bacterium]|nr:hypothetical protein [Saprospiraceae bacterium]
MNRIFIIFFIIITGCNRNSLSTLPENGVTDRFDASSFFPIPKSPQRKGDPNIGKKYLLEGDYLDSGIPLALMESMGMAPKMDDVLGRSGKNATMPPVFTATTSANGVEIIAPNCLICHGAFLDDKYIIGLGNYDFDGTMSTDFALKSMGFMVEKKYSKNSKEWESFEQFYKSTLALSGNTKTESVGANSADKITEVLLAHRKMPNMEWSDEPLLSINEFTAPADPPAWWLLKKKNAQFTTGIGRGDFARISTASSLLTMNDIDKVKEIDSKFTDIVAFIKSLDAPEYPDQIDQKLASKGGLIFNNTCSKCHGTYGSQETYPNFIVHHDIIKTDPSLAESYHERKVFVDLYNDSWFGEGDHAAHIVPSFGYVAPPLDGVWATGPYLHNGSVPTIEGVLNSKQRPTYWKRSHSPKDYNYTSLGWKYEKQNEKIDKYTYDTTLKGYGNQGYYFGDNLSENERFAVIEYLKTL